MVDYEIDKINYSEYVGIVKETNRPSGGIKTVHKVCVNAYINKNSKVLEIGCNTGFTSINIARLTNAEVTGIDLVEESIKESKRRAELEKNLKLNFEKESVTNLPYEDNTFDVLWLSNVLSFIKDKEAAIKECFRVLKNNGFLVFIPIYYLSQPDNELLDKVEEAIGTKIDVRTKKDWLNLIDKFPFYKRILYQEDFKYKDVGSKINSYLENVFDKKELKNLEKSSREKLFKKGEYFMKLFNENLKYAGYSIFIIQKLEFEEEEELFLTEKK